MKTDSQLQQDVSAELKWEPSVHAARIGVEVKDGVVTLASQVDSYSEKWNAERAAQRVAGGKAVKSDIEAALKRTSIADAKKISVAVHGSDVTLSGTVHGWDERDAATNSAWGTPGVRNVVEMMTLSY